MGLLNIGAGASEGLDDLFKRQLTEDKLAEDKRSTLATEDYRNRALNETSALRRQTQESTDQERMRQDQDRNDNRITRTVNMRPIGATVTPKERETEVAAGVPSALYKEHLPQVASHTIQGAVDAKGKQVGAPNAATNEEAPGKIEFTGTGAELTGQQRIDDANTRADQANADRDAARNIANHREDRLTSYGPPTIVIGSSDSPTGAKVVSRSDLPKGGADAPGTGAQKQAVSDAQVANDTLDRLMKSYSADKVGPIEGRLNTARQVVPFVSNKTGFPEFAADTATLRNAIIRAITGAQMSQPEADRIMAQIPSENDKEDTWMAKAASTRNNLANIVAHKGPTGTSGTSGGAKSGNIKSVREIK